MKRASQKGFTIVELLIVIVVIGILAALVLNTFAGVQARARDAERQTDLKALAEHLEIYFTDNGHYPATPRIGNASGGNTTWIQSNLVGLDLGAITPPNSDAPNIQVSKAMATLRDNNQYGYRAYIPGGVATNTLCTSDTPANEAQCASFELYWYSEDKKALQTIKSLNYKD